MHNTAPARQAVCQAAGPRDIYQWLAPVGPSWWTDLVSHANPAPIDFTASIPSFAIAFALAAAASFRYRRWSAAG